MGTLAVGMTGFNWILVAQGNDETPMLVIVLAAVAMFGAGLFWLWLIVHAAKNPWFTPAERVMWVLVILVMGCLGMLLYLIAAGKREPDEPPRA
jgi:hypothetical protein